MSEKTEKRLNLISFLPVEFLLRHRKIVIAFFLILTIASIFLLPMITVNYDMREYLPAESSTSEALQLLEQTFGIEGSAVVMVDAENLAQALPYKDLISKIDGVEQVIFLDDIFDIAQPLEWQDNEQVKLFYRNGQALLTVTFTEDDYSKSTADALKEIETAFAELDVTIAMAGPAVRTANMTAAATGELLWILAVVIPLFLVILLIFTDSYAEAVLFLAVIGIAVIINIGTNAFFQHISFMTHLSVAVLQLAISMDYSIFLLHRFNEERQTEPDLTKAMIKAVRGSFAPITASALTTVAGFLALVSMRYSLGKDMGLVLSKGIVLSLVCVLFLLPTLTITFIKIIDKSAHRNLLPSFKRFGAATLKIRYLLIPIWILLIVFAFPAQSNNSFVYGESAIMASHGSQVEIDQQLIDDVFGRQNPLLVIFPSGQQDLEYRLTEQLEKLPQISSLQSVPALADPALPRQLLPAQAIDQFEQEGYSRLILNLDTDEESAEAFGTIAEIRAIVDQENVEAVVFGATTSVEDIKQVVEHDYSLVNLTSILAVALILFFTFRSLSLPVILILVIESAIWFNMSVPYIAGKSISFIGYMIVSSIQLGATIDYAILLTSRYIECRQEQTKLEAAKEAIDLAGGSIFTSAGILTAAGFAVYFVSKIEGIQELGLLIGRGALLSGILVLVILPQLLVLLDKVISFTNLDRLFLRKRRN